MEVDHVTLRRHLVDERYLTRDACGSAYRLAQPLPNLFEPDLHGVDPIVEMHRARLDRAARKAQFIGPT